MLTEESKHVRLETVRRALIASGTALYRELREVLNDCRVPSTHPDFQHVESAFLSLSQAIAHYGIVIDGLREQDV